MTKQYIQGLIPLFYSFVSLNIKLMVAVLKIKNAQLYVVSDVNLFCRHSSDWQ